MDHFTMAISLFVHLCFFLLLFCHSSGRRTLDVEDVSFHESPDHEKFQRSRRQSVSEALSKNETATTSHTTKNEMTSKISSTTLVSVVEITGKSVLISQDNATVATFTPTTSYIMPVDKSSAYIQSENSSHDASVHSKSTSIASTQLSTVAMSNSSTQNTIIETKVTTFTSTILEAPATTTDSTFKNHVTSVVTFVTGEKHKTGQTPTTTLSMATQTTRQEVKEETAFGRYGLLAFGITIAMILILVFALIFVLTRRRKKSRPVVIQDEDRSPRLRMLEVPGLGEGKDDGLQTYSLGYDNGNNRISVRPPGGIQTPFAGVSTFMLSKRGSNASTNGSSSGYISPRTSTMSPLKESPYEFQPLVSDTPSRKGSQRSNQSKKSMKISEEEHVSSEI